MVARGNNSEYENTRKMQETIKESIRLHMTILDNLDDYDNTENEVYSVEWNGYEKEDALDGKNNRE